MHDCMILPVQCDARQVFETGVGIRLAHSPQAPKKLSWRVNFWPWRTNIFVLLRFWRIEQLATFTILPEQHKPSRFVLFTKCKNGKVLKSFSKICASREAVFPCSPGASSLN